MTEQGINELAARRDEQWEEVIELCRRYGYLTQETGQSATLMKNAISTFFSTMLPTVLSNLSTWLTTIISSIGLWPIAIAGLVVLFIAVVNQFGDAIQAKLQEVDAWLQGIFTRDWSETFGILGNLLNAFFSNVKNIWDMKLSSPTRARA